MIGRCALALAATLLAVPAGAAEVGGVELAERVTARDGTSLRLHGAGMRDKLFFDIYVGALYLPRTGQTPEQMLGSDQPGRVEMHFVYDEVERDKLAEAWRDGFAANNDREVYDTIAGRLDDFIALFPAATAGDAFAMEYVPGRGTRVTINGEPAGTIAGGEFFRALLAVFIGPKPPDSDLKAGLLGRD